MHQKIKNQLVMSDGTVVVELPSRLEGFRCWVAISALPKSYWDNPHRHDESTLNIKGFDKSKVPLNARRIFTVRKVLVNEECITNDWDVGPNDVVMDFYEVKYSFEDLIDFLNEQKIDTFGFREPWNTDYPL